MNCPKCTELIPDAAVIKAAASLLGRRPKLKARGKPSNNPSGRPKRPQPPKEQA